MPERGTGFVFPDGGFGAKADRVAARADDPAAIRRMGRAGRRLIEAEHGPAACARRFGARRRRRGRGGRVRPLPNACPIA